MVCPKSLRRPRTSCVAPCLHVLFWGFFSLCFRGSQTSSWHRYLLLFSLRRLRLRAAATMCRRSWGEGGGGTGGEGRAGREKGRSHETPNTRPHRTRTGGLCSVVRSVTRRSESGPKVPSPPPHPHHTHTTHTHSAQGAVL